jgi:virginiamycin B lyase
MALGVLLAAGCAAASRDVPASSAPAPVSIVTLAPSTGSPAASSGASTASSAAPGATAAPRRLEVTEFRVGAGQGPHDVAPAADGGVWYTAQRTGELGWLDPRSGEYATTKLGAGSAPHGVIVGPDGNAWVTDGGLNAIVKVDARTKAVTRYPLPAARANANLNTAAFDRNGTLWFTGQNGIYGRLDPRSGAMTVYDSPRGAGPYGITACADGRVYYASLANSFIARIDIETGTATVIEPPTPRQGARRVWCDSQSAVWVSEWNAGRVARYRPIPSTPPIECPVAGACAATGPATHPSYGWTEWSLPGPSPMAYAVFVDENDVVWLTDFGANALVRFDPATETFTVLPHAQANAAVRQLLGRPGEVWGAMSGQDKLLVVRTR